MVYGVLISIEDKNISCYSKKHATFGDVTKLITQEWVQQLYETYQGLSSFNIINLYSGIWSGRRKHMTMSQPLNSTGENELNMKSTKRA